MISDIVLGVLLKHLYTRKFAFLISCGLIYSSLLNISCDQAKFHAAKRVDSERKAPGQDGKQPTNKDQDKKDLSKSAEALPGEQDRHEAGDEAQSPIPIGGVFLTCLANLKNADDNIANTDCFMTPKSSFPWEATTVEVGAEQGPYSEIEFSLTPLGIRFSWNRDLGNRVKATNQGKTWQSNIEFKKLITIPPPLGTDPTTSPCEGFLYDKGCFYLANQGDSCGDTCALRGGFDFDGTLSANSSTLNCNNILNGLEAPDYGVPIRAAQLNAVGVVPGTGCGVEVNNNQGPFNDSAGRWIVEGDTPTENAAEPSVIRACSCNE